MITNLNRVSRLVNYYSAIQNNSWVLLGNTQPWENETLPPSPSPFLTQIVDGYKFYKVTSIKAAHLSNDGTINSNFGILKTLNTFNINTLLDLSAFYLIIDTHINSNDITSDFRSISLCTNLNPSSNDLIVPYNSNYTYDLQLVNFVSSPTLIPNNVNITRFILDF